MVLYNSSSEYLYNLYTCTSSEAKRLWRKTIKEKWNHKCAYCGSEEDLTIDHVIPRSKGGVDFSTNVVCCCKNCNASKSHFDWEIWYEQQSFFSKERKNKITQWMNGNKKQDLYVYGSRRNNAS